MTTAVPFVTPAEGEAKKRAQARYRAALAMMPAAARDAAEDYTRLLERDLLSDFERFTRIHEQELSPESVMGKWVSRPSGVAYLQLAHLRQTHEIIDAIRDLLDRGAVSLILDVRDAPGASVEQTVRVASEFITSGPIMHVKQGKERRRYDAIGSNGSAASIPIIALASRFTASAAEALLAALQHHRRATVIGESSFGKVWMWQRRSDGTEVKTGEWLSPSGELLRKGVVPDIAVADARHSGRDAILDAALAHVEAER